jgi:hypothetical protein
MFATRVIGHAGHYGPPETSDQHRKDKLLNRKGANPRFASDDSVAVVGGSAAGLYTASLLARAGKTVRVFERAERLDPAPRTLIVTHRLRELLGPLAERSIVNEIRRFELFTDGRAATIPLERPDLVIERSRLIQDPGPVCRGRFQWRIFGARTPVYCTRVRCWQYRINHAEKRGTDHAASVGPGGGGCGRRAELGRTSRGLAAAAYGSVGASESPAS